MKNFYEPPRTEAIEMAYREPVCAAVSGSIPDYDVIDPGPGFLDAPMAF